MSFSDEILQALVERDGREQAWAGMIEHQRKLCDHMLLMRDRNRSLLQASARSGHGGMASADSAVRAAYVTSLEQQIATLREELTGVYKTQSQNAQRLIHLTETLREAEDRSRHDADHIRELRAGMDKLTRRAEEARILRKEKERNIEHLNDELATLQLEFSQLEKRNADLAADHKNMFSRQIARAQVEAAELNMANALAAERSRAREVEDSGIAMSLPVPLSRPLPESTL